MSDVLLCLWYLYNVSNRSVCHSSTTLDLYSRRVQFRPRQAILSGFRGFLQYLRTNSTTIPQVDHFFFLISRVGVESKLGSLGTSAILILAYCTCPGDCEDGEFGRGNRNTRRKPAPASLCPPQIPLDQTRDWTWAAAVGSQRLAASAMARP
jgi:hypothetical protein